MDAVAHTDTEASTKSGEGLFDGTGGLSHVDDRPSAWPKRDPQLSLDPPTGRGVERVLK
jgi:hypothetical protein